MGFAARALALVPAHARRLASVAAPVVAFSILVAACSPMPSNPPGARVSANAFSSHGSLPGGPTAAATSCNAASPSNPWTAHPQLREVEGRGVNVSLWMLVEGAWPIRVGQASKLIVRMTGRGALQLSAVGPNGERLRPQDGPNVHEGSDWARPGDEWGSGWTFPTAGCWTVKGRRDGNDGSVALIVLNGSKPTPGVAN